MRFPIVFDTVASGSDQSVTIFDADGQPRLYARRSNAADIRQIEVYRDQECVQRLFTLRSAGSQILNCRLLDDENDLIGTLNPTQRNFWGREVRQICDAQGHCDAAFRRSENWNLLLGIGMYFIPVVGSLASTYLKDQKRFDIIVDGRREGRLQSHRKVRKIHHRLSLSDELDPDLQLRLALAAVAVAMPG